MRRALVALGALGGLAACSLGLVDAPPPAPSPATLALTTRLEPDASEPGWVELTIVGTLDPGISEAGEQRRALNGQLRIDGLAHASVAEVGQVGLDVSSGRLTWTIVERFPHPGPRSVRVDFPSIEGLATPSDVQLLVGAELSPEGAVLLAGEEDLVLGVTPRSGQLSSSGRFTTRDRWVLDLSAPDRDFHMTLSANRWPNVVRVPSMHLPRDAFPLAGTLMISRLRTSSELAVALMPAYRLEIQTTIVKQFTVGAAPGA